MKKHKKIGVAVLCTIVPAIALGVTAGVIFSQIKPGQVKYHRPEIVNDTPTISTVSKNSNISFQIDKNFLPKVDPDTGKRYVKLTLTPAEGDVQYELLYDTVEVDADGFGSVPIKITDGSSTEGKEGETLSLSGTLKIEYTDVTETQRSEDYDVKPTYYVPTQEEKDKTITIDIGEGTEYKWLYYQNDDVLMLFEDLKELCLKE